MRSTELSSYRTKPHVAPFVGPAWYVAAAWLACALVVQSTVLHYLAFHGVVPSVVFAVVLWYAIRVDTWRATLYGLVAGLGEDALSAQTGASCMIATGASAMLASILSRGFFADSVPLVVTITLVATLVRALLYWGAVSLMGYPPGLGAMHLHEAALQSVLNAVVMVVAMLIVRRTNRVRQ
ncbi:MAG: rod shape-determining protein MreD [Candidatus Eremiobacteraeota bacterium]|nr:rod shape-determining protein MreD [Candidatus Eremiobacteraeota bacterium]